MLTSSCVIIFGCDCITLMVLLLDPRQLLLIILLLIEMGSEKVLDLSQPVSSQMTSRVLGKRPAVYLRYDEPNPTGGYIRIYPKGLR